MKSHCVVVCAHVPYACVFVHGCVCVCVCVCAHALMCVSDHMVVINQCFLAQARCSKKTLLQQFFGKNVFIKKEKFGVDTVCSLL